MPSQNISYTFTAADKFTAISKRIGTRAKWIQRRFKDVNKTLKKTGEALKKLGRATRTFSLAAAAALGAAVFSFSKMESGVTNVLTLLDKPEFDKFGEKIKALSLGAIRFGFDIDDANKGLFNMVSALGANEVSFEAFEQAQKLAKAGVTELSISVKGIAAVVNAYGKEVTKADEVANAFFAGQKRGTTTVGELASSVGQVAPIAKNAGVSFQELLATMAQLTQGGLSTEEATTSLKGVLTALLKPGKEAEAIFTKQGIAFGATQLKAVGLNETLAQLNKLQAKHPDLLAKALPNIRAFTGSAALSEAGLKQILSTIEEMKDKTAFDEALLKQMNTFKEQTKALKGELTVVAIQIGEALVPVLRLFLAILKPIVSGFSKLGPTAKSIVAIMLVLAAGFSTAATVFGVFLTALPLMIAGFGALGLSMIPITLPMLGIAAVILAIIAGVTALIVNFEFLKNTALSTFDSVMGFLGFGDDIKVDASRTTNINSTLGINLGVDDPRGIVKSISTVTTGSAAILNEGKNMVTQ